MKKKPGPLVGGAIPVTLALLLSGCGGSIGTQSSGESAAGFEFGSSQEDVSDAIENLDPVTLTFQPYSQSPTSEGVEEAEAFMAAVEERSNGQINIEVAWGQSIAGFGEMDDALADGRVDLAWYVPVYDPAQYPIFDAHNKASYSVSSEPIAGEVATLAATIEVGWSDSALLAEFTDKGLTPLNPLMSTGNYWTACNAEGTSLDDWDGRQIRIGGSAQSALAESVGAIPVSLQATEAYEALQRNTVECTFAQGVVVGPFGLAEAAPHLSTFSGGGMSSIATGIHLAGSSFIDLPLPYQQIIFDASAVDWAHGHLHHILAENAAAIGAAKNAGGGIEPMDSAAEERMTEAQNETLDKLIDEGLLDEGIGAQYSESAEKWLEIAGELGYTGSGELKDFDEWFEPEGMDFRPFAERLAEEGALSHRPA